MTNVLLTLLTACTFFVAVLLTFLLLQKPLFLLHNRKAHPVARRDVWLIYRHGMRLDVAAAGMLVFVPLLVLVVAQVWTAFPVRTVLAAYAVLSALLLSLAALADAVLYPFWDSKLDASVLSYLDSPGKFSSVSGLFVAAAVGGFVALWGAVSLWLCLPLCLLPLPSGDLWLRLLAAALLLLLGVANYLFLVWGGTRRHGRKAVKPNSPAKAFFSPVAYHNHAALNPFYNFVYTLSYRRDFDREFRFMSPEEAREQYCRCLLDNGGRDVANPAASALLTTPRPNVLLVIMESWGAPFVESLGGAPGVTPCFDRLTREGIYFTHCYCSSIRTDRAIVSLLSGYPGQPTFSIIKSSSKLATLPGLPATLRREGYETTLMHGGDLRIFNKYEYYQRCGHERLVDINDFPPEERTQRWGVPDHVVMERAVKEITERRDFERPWMMTIQTLSSHLPYDVPWQLLDDRVLNCYAYADRALGQMIDRLRAVPEVWERLLVVCMADHGMPYQGLTSAQPAFAHIPWLMLGGAVREPMVIDRVVSQTDLPATLLSMMGVGHGEYAFSRDVFSPGYAYPCAFNTYNNGLMLRDADGCTVWDNTRQSITYGSDDGRLRAGQGLLQYLYHDLSLR